MEHTPQSVTYRLEEMELRLRSGISGPRAKPRATSLGRKSADMNKVDGVENETLVNPPSSATGVTRDGKSSSRIHPVEGGRTRTSNPPRRAVARDKPGKAATWAGELRPIDNL